MIPQHGTLQISRSRFLHNASLLRAQIAPTTQICATIKADAYGHGATTITQLLKDAAINWACIYSLNEAKHIAHLNSSLNLLALAPIVLTSLSEATTLAATLETTNIRINLTDLPSAHLLDQACANLGLPKKLNIHTQLDTGLTRVGANLATAPELLSALLTSKHLHLEGLFSHLSHGDVPNHPNLQEQHNRFQQFAAHFKNQTPYLLLHLQNSGGTFNLQHSNPNEPLDLVRTGIALYGLQPSTAHPIPNLLPIAQVTAPILAIHERPPNTGVGYGHTFITTRHSRLAILPVGYADGYPRLLSNNAIAQLHDTDLPVVGRISMDQIILDITDLPSAKLGDTVTVISNNPEKPNSLDQMAHAIGTIGYELATHLSAGGNRLNRIIVD